MSWRSVRLRRAIRTNSQQVRLQSHRRLGGADVRGSLKLNHGGR